MTSNLTHETIVQAKLAATTATSAGISISAANDWVALIAGCIAIIVGIATVIRIYFDVQDKRARARERSKE